MIAPCEGLYRGEVVHSRVGPVQHKLRYRVFACLFDCNRLDHLNRRLRLFSYNRFNLFSLFDRDHGDGTPIGAYLRSLSEKAGLGEQIERFLMLCYPRVAGYVFNPLTVYYGVDRAGKVRLVVYEVNNTFGQRQTYVLPVETENRNGLIVQSCDKTMRVSPFNAVNGRYSFHLTPPGESLVVGVALRGPNGPVLKAHFRGRRQPISDAALLRAVASTGWMTINVYVGIHWEALKLWIKGLRPPRSAGAPLPHDSPIVHKVGRS
jgi:uncharacterized protein